MRQAPEQRLGNCAGRLKGDYRSNAQRGRHPLKAFQEIGVVFAQLDMVMLLHTGEDRFRVPESVPCWWKESWEDYRNPDSFRLDDDRPFLQNFLVDAFEFWERVQGGNLPSGVWEETFHGRGQLYEAYAIHIGDDRGIAIESLRSTRFSQSEIIRAGRNTQLELLKDIARSQLLELQLKNARDAAVRLENTKTQLLANTSHELRTPLTGILGMLEVLADEAPQAGGLINDALEAAKGLQRIVNDLLDFAALEAGRKQVEVSDVCPADLVRDVAHEFKPAAEQRGLSLHYSVPEGDPWTVKSDPIRLRQILNNLVDNAIRYSDKGVVTLKLSHKPDGHFQFIVSDSGRGIAMQDRERIFEAFQRGRNSKPEDGGTGLGLAIVKEITSLLNGTLSLHTQLDRGTEFIVQFPFAPAQPQPRSISRSATETKTKADEAVDLPPGLRILLAEDNPTNRKYLAHILRRVGAIVDEVSNGAELVDRARCHEYDLILTDFRMSGMDGLSAAARIKDDGERGRPAPPIIAITAHARGKEAEPAWLSKFDDIITKPFSREEFYRRVAQVIGKTSKPERG